MASFFDIKPKAAAPAPGGASADDVKGAVRVSEGGVTTTRDGVDNFFNGGYND